MVNILLVFTSDFGSTRAMAESVAAGARVAAVIKGQAIFARGNVCPTPDELLALFQSAGAM